MLHIVFWEAVSTHSAAFKVAASGDDGPPKNLYASVSEKSEARGAMSFFDKGESWILERMVVIQMIRRMMKAEVKKKLRRIT